jgi:lipopolysaccharide export system protein LptA
MVLPPQGFEAFALATPGELLTGERERERRDKAGGSDSPVEVVCETFLFREAGQGRAFSTADFSGGVEVTHGPQMRLRCERVLAELEPPTNSLHRLVATGAVVMDTAESQGRRVARGDRAEYVASEDRFWLTGDEGVEMDFMDADGTHRGRGGLAFYTVGAGVLELRNRAVLDSVHGRLSGDWVRVDREARVLAAGGRWRMVVPLRQEVQESLKAIEEGGGR